MIYWIIILITNIDMLNNLDELHLNLKSLVEEISQIHKKISNPIENRKKNNQSILIKIPKVIMIIKICPYLEESDIITLSTVCAGMRKIIFSPIGWVLLSRIHSPYPIIFTQKVSNLNADKKYFFHDVQSQNSLSTIDQKLLKKARSQCKAHLMALFQKYKFNQEEYTELLHQLKSEKTLVQRLKLKSRFFEQKRQLLQQKNWNYRSQLRQINEGFAQKIQDLDKINEDLVKQTGKLQNQKEALVGKIRQYQNQIQTIKNDSQKSKQILKKIKNYLLYKQL